jgi:hypothetical protein
MIDQHARFALDHPVYDPTTQILPGHFWRVLWKPNWSITAGLTVNLGME